MAKEAKVVDARGLSCPQPVFLTLKAIEAGEFPFRVIVDNPTAKANIRRMAQGKKFNVAIDESGEDIVLTISK